MLWSVDVLLPALDGFGAEEADEMLSGLDPYGGGAVAVDSAGIEAGIHVEAPDAPRAVDEA